MPRNIFRILPFVLIGLAYLAGMFLDIMEIDAAQYAVMTRDMLREGDLMHLMDRGRDYLDKPPLIFWSTAVSYWMFGVSNFSYKLPSVLFSLLALYSTYRFVLLYQGRRTAYLAALILASCQAFFLMNNDVKTDMYLIGPVMLAVWQLSRFRLEGKWGSLLLGSVAVGLGILAKGPLGLVVPALALGTDFLLRRDWKGLFRWQWLLVLPVVALVLLPFCIGLYQQFGSRGVEFFLWTQSFGRITGDSEWTNDASSLFLVHTYLWAFLPWTVLSTVSIYREIRDLVKGGFRISQTSEAISVGGFVLVFLALSMSRFKLPHYIFVVFPFAAIMTARYLMALVDSGRPIAGGRFFLILHTSLFVLTMLFLGTLMVWAFPGASVLIWAILGLGLVGVVFGVFRSSKPFWKHLFPTAIGFTVANLILSLYIYPQLLSYQSPAIAGKYIAETGIEPERVFAFHKSGRTLDLYGGQVVSMIENPNLEANWPASAPDSGPIYIFTSAIGLAELQESNVNMEVVDTYEDFRVARLSLPFINPELRSKVVAERYLLLVNHP